MEANGINLPAFYDAEDLVAKFQLLVNLDLHGGYEQLGNTSSPLWNRVQRALGALPDKFVPAAQALFANTLYITPAMIEAGWQSIYQQISARTGLQRHDLTDKVAFFQQRGDDLVLRFFRANQISGTLDTDRCVPIDNPYQLRDTLAQVADHPRSPARDDVRAIFSKQYWVVLTDYALSGTSVASDVRRLTMLRERISPLMGSTPQILICPLVFTSQAAGTLQGSAAAGSDRPEVLHAISFDERHRINSPQCALFHDRRVRQNVSDLCRYFYKHFVVRDPALANTILRSNNDMTFGFKNGGWTVVSAHNCPNNSIPLLWYSTGDGSLFEYVGPFPRNHSRINQTTASKGRPFKISDHQLRQLKIAFGARRGASHLNNKMTVRDRPKESNVDTASHNLAKPLSFPQEQSRRPSLDRR